MYVHEIHAQQIRQGEVFQPLRISVQREGLTDHQRAAILHIGTQGCGLVVIRLRHGGDDHRFVLRETFGGQLCIQHAVEMAMSVN